MILASGSVPSDTEVVLLCSEDLSERLGQLDDSVKILPLPDLVSMSRWDRHDWWRQTYPQILRRVSPDVVLYSDGHMQEAYRGFPSVVMSQNLLPFDGREILRYVPHRFAAVLILTRMRHACSFKKADGVIFLSNCARRQIWKSVPQIKRSAVIYYSLDNAFLEPAPRTETLNEPVNLLYVSSVHLYKHHCALVEATSLVRNRLRRDIRLTLVGDGESVATAKLDRKIAALGASSYVCKLGKVHMMDMIAAYRAADVFVFASSCEAFGLALLEAMGMGLPIACSNRSAMPEFLRDGGVYFDPEKPESIAGALSELIMASQKRWQCARKAWEYSREFSWHRCSAETFAFLRSVAESR